MNSVLIVACNKSLLHCTKSISLWILSRAYHEMIEYYHSGTIQANVTCWNEASQLLYRMRKVGLEPGFKMGIDENVWFINSQGDRIPLTGHESNNTESRETILTSAALTWTTRIAIGTVNLKRYENYRAASE
jgi:hypothetical protein